MDKKAITSIIKALMKSVSGLIKQFEAEKKRLEKASQKSDKKIDELLVKSGEAMSGEQRKKIDSEIAAVPEYDDAISIIGDIDDGALDSVLGALDQVHQDLRFMLDKIDVLFSKMPKK